MRTLGSPGGPARLLQLLLLLLPASLMFAGPEWPLPAATRSAQPLLGKFWGGGGGGEEQPSSSAMEIPPSHYQALRAAGVVSHYVMYQRGSPHRLLEMGRVNQASLEDIPGTGHKYHLKFEVKENIQNDSSLNCTAEILYHHDDTSVAPEIYYTMEGEFETHSKEADNIFYNRIQHLSEPLETKNIPDKFGAVSWGPPLKANGNINQRGLYKDLSCVHSCLKNNDGNMTAEMKPIFNLAKVASGYIIWQNSTENTWYNMIQIQNVKQMKRNDDYLEFSYEVLFHDIASQEIIPWHMQVLWHPQHGVKVAQNSRQPK